MQSPSVFENCTLTSLSRAIVLVGGLTSHPSPGYTIRGNTFANISTWGVLMGPACNVSIVGNQFTNVSIGVDTDGAAYQGTDYNHDITVVSNSFNQVYYALNIGSVGADRVEKLTFSSNLATNCHRFACGYGWNSNVVFQSNTSYFPGNLGNVLGSSLSGQWFFDDPSNQFPLYGDFGYRGITNIVSYACGMRHTIYNSNGGQTPDILYGIDDRTPEQIPPGAQLSLTNLNAVPVNIMLSLRNPSAGMVVLQPNSLLQLYFTNNSFYVLTALLPPNELRVGFPQEN
jgi:hypothetical protein